MYHPYRQGYSVLPALQPLNEPPFCVDDRLDYYLAEKRAAAARQKVFLECDVSDAVHAAFAEFIATHGPKHVRPPYTLQSVAMQVQEDIAIHRVQDGRDWLAATHICFPSQWRPEEKIGRPLAEIHAPVPGMNLGNSHKLAQAMVHRGPFMRFVWSVIHDDRINGHPDRPRAAFDTEHPVANVKVERQIIWGLPECGAALFILRQYVLREVEVDMPALYAACQGMNAQERAYKNVGDGLLDYLRGRAAGHRPQG